MVDPAIRGGDGDDFLFPRPAGTFSAGRIAKGRLYVIDLIGDSGLQPISPTICPGHLPLRRSKRPGFAAPDPAQAGLPAAGMMRHRSPAYEELSPEVVIHLPGVFGKPVPPAWLLPVN
jgi:hypothetical protein